MISPLQNGPEQKQTTSPLNSSPEVNLNQLKTVAEETDSSASRASTNKNRETQPSVYSPLNEEKMEINSTDILNLYRDHANIEKTVLKEASDIRQEDTKGFGDIKYAVATGNDFINREILRGSHDTAVKVDEAADKIQQRAADFYIASQARDFDTSRDLSALKSQVDMANQKLSTEILLSSERAAAAAALESAKVAAAVALGQSQLSKEIADSKYETSKQISLDGEKTRELINSLKTDELNRLLIERNTDLQGCRHDYWAARDGLFNSQFAALSSQVNSQFNALNSQVAETRQGMVNFGTMAGVGQSSTSNAVR
jgi:hypothetical protein